MRKVWKVIAGWLHAAMLLSLFAPVCYCFGFHREDSDYLLLYIRCWMILIPIILSWKMIRICKGFGSYLLLSVLLLVGMGFLCYFTGPYLEKSTFLTGYVCIMIAESVLILALRYYDRLNDDQKNMKSDRFDPNKDDDIQVLNEPALPHLVWVGIVYGMGLYRKQPTLCNIALGSVIAYMILYLLFHYLKRTEHYLKLNNRVANLPGRRLYGITGGVLAAIIIAVLLMIVPAMATIPYRNYWNGGEWQSGYTLFISVPEEEQQEELETEADYDPRVNLDFGKKRTMPAAEKAMIYVIAGLLLLGFIICIIRQIRETFRDFRKSFDENGDQVEDLGEVEEEADRSFVKPKRKKKESWKEQIRREYRKMIRKNRKDMPKPGETPSEIEAAAGLSEDADMKVLHEKYEEVRYQEEK